MTTTATTTDTAEPREPLVGGSVLTLLAIGAVCGLAWAAGLRGFMAQIAGPESTVQWYGTFVQILLPGVLTGMLLGHAEHLRRTGGRRRWWHTCAPLTFVLFVVVSPAMIETVLAGEIPFSDGLGGGAVALPLFGIAGGYALSGRGPRWGRIAAGTFALLPYPGWTIAAVMMSPDGEGLGTPEGLWVTLLFFSFIAVLQLACTIPHRHV